MKTEIGRDSRKLTAAPIDLFVGEPRRAFAALADLTVAEAVVARFLGTPADFSTCGPARVLDGRAGLAAPN